MNSSSLLIVCGVKLIFKGGEGVGTCARMHRRSHKERVNLLANGELGNFSASPHHPSCATKSILKYKVIAHKIHISCLFYLRAFEFSLILSYLLSFSVLIVIIV